MSGKFTRTSTGLHRLSLSRRWLPSFWRGRRWWLMNIPSMWRRACMRHLLCTRTLVRLGVTDGAIDVTSAAGGKVSDM